MVKSERLYSPQNYLTEVTGKCYIHNGEDDIKFVQEILAENGFELWDYPLNEIDHIVENGLNVVLVDCMVVNPKTDNFEHVYRWFEVPEDFEENDEENSVSITFEEFVERFENGTKTFEDVYTEMGFDSVECVGNIVYDDQDLYDFLEALGSEISDYEAGHVVIKTNSGKIYKIPCEERVNRFDPEYPNETVLFFEGCKVYDVTEK